MSFEVLVYTHISLSIVVSFVRYEIGRRPVSQAAPADFFDDSYSLSYSKQEKNARGQRGGKRTKHPIKMTESYSFSLSVIFSKPSGTSRPAFYFCP